MSYKHCPHLNCRYRRENNRMFLGNCAYMDITGHSRIKGLTMAQARDTKHCPRYEPKEGEEPAHRAPIPIDRTNARIRELYDQGCYDKKIAEKLGISKNRVICYRKRNKLPANKEPAKTRYDWEKGMELYRKGLNDVEIAKELNCSNQTVWNWRQRMELPANTGRFGRDRSLQEDNDGV